MPRITASGRCPYRLCNPDVSVVKTASDGHRHDAPDRPNGAPMRRLLRQRDTCAVIVIEAGVCRPMRIAGSSFGPLKKLAVEQCAQCNR